MVLTFVTAVAAAWWPARAVARISVVAALSGARPDRNRPTGSRPLGGALLGIGLVLLAVADQHRAVFTIGGTVATPVGVILLAPLTIQGLAAVGRRAPIAVRLALRDLASYQARSGAALGAITLAVGIAATIAISASAAQTPTGPGNLAANQLMLYLTRRGRVSPVPPLTLSSRRPPRRRRAGGREFHGAACPSTRPYNPHTTPVRNPAGTGGSAAGSVGANEPHLTRCSPRSPHRPRGRRSMRMALYVATPAVLSHTASPPAQIDPSATSSPPGPTSVACRSSIRHVRPPERKPPTVRRESSTLRIQVLRPPAPYTSAEPR